MRKENGEIVYLDFEFFGWDDPAKMISDFVLHPGMNLKETYKRRFIRNLIDNFKDNKNLENRVKVVYPLVGLVWCLITLNEFLPLELERRKFSNEAIDEELQIKQLAKSENLLRKIKIEYKTSNLLPF